MSHSTDWLSQLRMIDEEDLQYIERDLCLYELVSLGFLLYGNERTKAEYVLQRLLVLMNTQNRTSTNNAMPPTNADLLLKYASINPENWRACLVEALAIIGARRVLRKMGFQWNALRQHFLPHIAELSLHIHPLLKALYKLCERLTYAETGRLVLDINEHLEQQQNANTHLRFYDNNYLEIFLLDWLTRRIITVGNSDASGADVQLLIDYFKLNEMDAFKMLIISTIQHNLERPMTQTVATTTATSFPSTHKQSEHKYTVADTPASLQSIRKSTTLPDSVVPEMMETRTITRMTNRTYDADDCYTVRLEYAGYVLIINQRNFYEETDETLKHLLPKKKLKDRSGTDTDHRRLKDVFTSYGYQLIEHENLTHIELQHHIREAAKRSEPRDSLIVCILSHGIDGAVYGSNSIPVDISDIDRIITADELRGKPKMLIIQACQKKESPNEDDTQESQHRKKPSASHNASPHDYGDMIKAMSTVPGFESMRHTIEGTWFIQALCTAVDKLGDHKHLLDILITVHREVTEKRGDRDESMMPLTMNTLRKYFFLPLRPTSVLS